MEDARRFLQQQKARQFLEQKRATAGHAGVKLSGKLHGQMMQMPGQLQRKLPGQMRMGLPGGPRLMSSMLQGTNSGPAANKVSSTKEETDRVMQAADDDSSNIADDAEDLRRKIALLEEQLQQENDSNDLDILDSMQSDRSSNTVTSSTSSVLKPVPPPPPPDTTYVIKHLDLAGDEDDFGEESSNADSADVLRKQIARIEAQIQNASVNASDNSNVTSNAPKINMPKRRQEAVIKMQSHGRKYIARKEYLNRKHRNDKAVMIQKYARGRLCRKKYLSTKQQNEKAAIIQKYARGRQERLRFGKRLKKKIHEDRKTAASNVQRMVRGRQARLAYNKKQDASRLIQKNIRGKIGRNKCKRLREKQALEHRLADLERRKRDKAHRVLRAEQDFAGAELMISSLQERKQILQKEYAKLRLQKKKFSDVEHKLTEEKKALDEESTKLMKKVNSTIAARYEVKSTPVDILSQLSSSIQRANDRLEEIRANNNIQRQELIDMRQHANSTKERVLKAFGKAMAEIRFQQFQHNAMKAAVNNMTQ